MMSFRQAKLLIPCLAALFSGVAANNNGRADGHGVIVSPRTATAGSNSSDPILETKGGITRHLGISRSSKFSTVWTWSLDAHGSLSWKDLGSNVGWRTYNSTSFISAPEVLNVWSSSKDLRVVFAIQAVTGHMLYLPYFGGQWESDDGWHDLGGRFTYRPASVSGTSGLSGVFGVNDDGELLYSALDNQYLPLKWSAWALMGTGFTGEVAVAAATPGMWELVGLANGTYKHGLTDYRGSPPEWTDLGCPPNSVELGWPKIVAIPDTRTGGSPRGTVDVVVVADGVIWHKLYDGSSWAAEWSRLPSSHDGLEVMNSQELLIGYGSSISPILADNGYLFSRGSDNCVYQNQFAFSGYNATTGQVYRDWIGWNNLWCPADSSSSSMSTDTQQSPLSIAAIDMYDNRFDFVVETPSGGLEHSQVYHDNGTFGGVVPEWVTVEGRP